MLKWLGKLLLELARRLLKDTAVVVVDKASEEAKELGDAVAKQAREAAEGAARQVIAKAKEEIARRREGVLKRLGK